MSHKPAVLPPVWPPKPSLYGHEQRQRTRQAAERMLDLDTAMNTRGPLVNANETGRQWALDQKRTALAKALESK